MRTQHDYSIEYLLGQTIAFEQIQNNGQGYPETDKTMTSKERSEFFKGYHAAIKESA